MPKIARRLWLIVLCLVLPATTLERLTLDQMTQKSTAIVRGTITQISAVQRGSVIYTVYRVQVKEVLKGAVGTSTDVFVAGGTLNGYRQSFAGSPEFKTGSEYVVFLWTSPKGTTQIIGLGQGAFDVTQSADGDAILTRGPLDASFVDTQGSPVEDAGMKLTLSGLRQRVKGAVR